MVGNIDRRRRFLASPQVYPAEWVSPAALLQSLVAIARDVERSYRSASFPTHRRSVREVMREVGILLQFFETVLELGGGGDAALLPDSAVLSLCDLHVTFQRMRHLVRDCGRSGARLWLLMRSDRASCEFRILVRSVATALDVLPLSAIDVPAEVKELVRLVAEQSWKVQISTDHADALVLKEVFSILDQFENGVGPDLPQLRRVLSHLQIHRWADCNEEVLFLEEELGVSLSSGGDMGEISLLSSLRGLMLYARAVVFDYMPDGQRSTSGGSLLDREAGKVLQHLNLQGLRCPISLELMADPVTVSTGQTYDRASITKWLKSGNRTCPVTGEKLQSTVLVPNSALQKLIRQARDGGGQQHCSGDIIAGAPWSSAAVGAVKMLCDFLVSKLSSGSEGERISTEAAAAVYEVRLLAKACAPVRGYMVEAGAIPWLLKLLSPYPITHPSLQEGAMAAIVNLSKHSRGRKVVFESGGLDPILRVLREGLTAAAQQNAAASIFYLSSVEEYRREIGDAIPALVALLRSGGVRGKKSAAVALFGVLLFPGNHRRVLGTGVTSDLVNLLTSSESLREEDLVGDCLAVLAALAEKPEGARAVMLSPGAVPTLATLLASPSSPEAAKECCVATLLRLCNNGGRRRVARLLNGLPIISLMPALYMVLAQGSPRAAKLAGSLISILHGEGQEGPAGAIAADAHVLQQEWAVPVQ